MEIRASCPTEAYVSVLEQVLAAPVVAPRGLRVHEVPERLSVVIDRPWGFVSLPGRRLNHAISVVEGLSLVGQCSVPEFQTDRVKVFSHFVNDGVFRGSYGPRVEGVLPDVVRLLMEDPWTRQAVLSVYDGHRDVGRWGARSVSGDVPCTLDIQFFVRPHEDDHRRLDSALHMWVTMRSNDAWRGTPYDFGQFAILQWAVAQALNLDVGTYTHSVGSFHLYEEHYDDARVLVDSVGEVYEPSSLEYAFGGDFSMASTSERARRILMGMLLDEMTSFENWMVQALDAAEHYRQIIDP